MTAKIYISNISLIRTLVFQLLVISLLLSSSPISAQGQQQPTPAVIVEQAKMETLNNERIYAGRTESVAKVDLIARVGGFLQPLEFKDGQLVKADEVLFVIEPGPYKYKVDQAQANLNSAKAKYDLANIEFKRKQQLVARNAISVSELDVAKANLQEAQAVVEQRNSELELANLDLSYTQIKAPMAGKVGAARYKEGAYVTADSGTLATVTALDPMRVAFAVPQDVILWAQRHKVNKADKLLIRLRLSDGSTYDQPGEMEYIDAQANPGTDTVTVHALFPNKNFSLFDSQLVDVIVSVKNAVPVLTVPQTALLVDQEGPFVLLVNKENTVEQRRIIISNQQDGKVVVASGLKEGDAVITAGIQKVRPGIKVTAKIAGQ
ncbi:efflux RND transporter periplasmic adaptor subunit [Flexibacterium corallicola]|uniref:efflux RND transporter periplasmic adaptor subunit n=1 Tax=Flexibacterium corallicola TaxID=3037259 RepID=UPI00286F8D3F|nr:efflux RND transporter periplasmic adaptor subunit [Pseudovibrio sp. M1P-2-3]